MGFIVHRAREGFVFALLAVIGIAAPAQGAAYTILDLGTLGGTASGTYGQNVLNASGQVVGVAATTGDAAYHAFRTPANAPIVQGPGGSDLGTLGDVYIEAYGINASGQAVGYSSGPIPQSSFEHAFRTAANGAIVPGGLERGTLVGTGNSAYGINASGQVVGYAASTTGNHAHAFRTAPNGPIVQGAGGSDLGTLGGLNSYAFGINDSGQAVGYSSIMFTGDPEHAFRTAPNGPIVQGPGGSDLGTLGGQKSFATAVNNSGQTVGFSDTPVYGEHAFRTAANATGAIDAERVRRLAATDGDTVTAETPP